MSKDALVATLSQAHARQARASLRVAKARRHLRQAEDELRGARREVRAAESAIFGELYQAQASRSVEEEREDLAEIAGGKASGANP